MRQHYAGVILHGTHGTTVADTLHTGQVGIHPITTIGIHLIGITHIGMVGILTGILTGVGIAHSIQATILAITPVIILAITLATIPVITPVITPAIILLTDPNTDLIAQVDQAVDSVAMTTAQVVRRLVQAHLLVQAHRQAVAAIVATTLLAPNRLHQLLAQVSRRSTMAAHVDPPKAQLAT